MSDMDKTDSVLNERPDGMGYYYGHYKGSRIDILPPPGEEEGQVWRLFVDGDPVGDGYTSKGAAEEAGKLFITCWGKDSEDDE